MTVKDFPNYSISEDGIITNITKKKIKAPVLDRQTGYYKIILWEGNKYKSFNLHYLIAIHFIPTVSGKSHINHKNGIKTDNRIENLEWCTMSENSRHSVDVLGNQTMEKRRNFKGALHTEYGFFCTAQEAANICGVAKMTMLSWLNGERRNKSKFVWSN